MVAVRLYELFRMHEHPARTAARIEHPALIRLNHLDKQSDNTSGRVKLPALLAFG